MNYIVILVGGRGQPLPMEDENEHVALFLSEEAANAAGRANGLGAAYGFEVIEWPYDVEVR